MCKFLCFGCLLICLVFSRVNLPSPQPTRPFQALGPTTSLRSEEAIIESAQWLKDGPEIRNALKTHWEELGIPEWVLRVDNRYGGVFQKMEPFFKRLEQMRWGNYIDEIARANRFEREHGMEPFYSDFVLEVHRRHGLDGVFADRLLLYYLHNVALLYAFEGIQDSIQASQYRDRHIKVLDLGIGEGEDVAGQHLFFGRIAQGATYVGIDNSTEAVSKSKEMTQQFGFDPNEIEFADMAEYLEAHRNEFDIITWKKSANFFPQSYPEGSPERERSRRSPQSWVSPYALEVLDRAYSSLKAGGSLIILHGDYEDIADISLGGRTLLEVVSEVVSLSKFGILGIVHGPFQNPNRVPRDINRVASSGGNYCNYEFITILQKRAESEISDLLRAIMGGFDLENSL